MLSNLMVEVTHVDVKYDNMSLDQTTFLLNMWESAIGELHDTVHFVQIFYFSFFGLAFCANPLWEALSGDLDTAHTV